VSDAPARPYRGVAADARRAGRRTRLEEAALALVRERGVDAVTVDGVCDAAGLTKRYFYESFADRDALLVTLLDELLDATRDAIGAAVASAGADPTERIRATVAALVDTLDADRDRARLYAEAPLRPALGDRRRSAQDEFADLLLDVVLEAGAERRVDALFVVAGATDVVTRWLLRDLDVDRPTLVERITRIGLALV
jgi:AcrR family transcriptional regulator